MIAVDLDSVEVGVMVYSLARVPIGIVRIHMEMNGNYAAKPRRVLDNGKWKDRFTYRQSGLYRSTKDAGQVLIAESEAAGGDGGDEY
jgi:hypothetical protein